MLTEKGASTTENLQSSKQIVITVIIPVYNCKKYLEDAVTSVLNQPYKNISVVLVDDGSTDGSGQLCDELAAASDRITALHQENAGVSAARNAGVEFALESSGCNAGRQYLAFLDADDSWTNHFFTDDAVAAFPEATIIRFQSVNCDSNLSRCANAVNVEEGTYDGGASTVRKCLSSHFGAALYASSLFRNHQIRFIEGLKYSEDVLFLRKCAYTADTITFINRVLYLYRNNPMSCVHTNTTTGFAYFEPMFRAYLTHDFDGRGFVSWYLVDAIESHFMYGGTVSEARHWMSEHPGYVVLARERGGDRARGLLATLDKHPYLYAGRCRLKGIVFISARSFIHIRPFLLLYNARRYMNKISTNREIIH